MKNVMASFIISTFLLSFYICFPGFCQSRSSSFSGNIHEGLKLPDVYVTEIVWYFTSVNYTNMISYLFSYDIRNSIELFSGITTKCESVSDVSTTQKTNSAPECCKHKCRVGLSDKEWEKGFHSFTLYLFLPFLSVLAGAMGWIPFKRD